MKNIVLLAATLLLANFASAAELTPMAKQLVLDAIAQNVYAEAGGLVRAPQSVADFTFTQLSAEYMVVEGSSFSAMDNRMIGYRCEIEILGREVIESEYDFSVVGCELTL